MNARSMMMLVAVIAITAIAVGCGSDEDSSGSSSLSKAEFIKRAGAVCYREREGALNRIVAYRDKHESEGLPDAVLAENAAKAVLLSTFGAEIAAIRALGAPAGDEDEVEAILAAQTATLEEAKELKGKMSSLEIEDYFADADEQLQDYGLARCVKSG